MAFNVSEIKSQMALDGARPSLFQVILNNPANSTGDLRLSFMCEAASLPPTELGEVQIPYFGRFIKLAGNRVYGDWTISIMEDEDFIVRNALEEWSNKMNSFEGNLRTFGSASPLLYKSQAQVIQYSKTGIPIREYQFEGVFPKVIGDIPLNWGTTNEIERYTVTFAVDLWTVSGGITGNAGGK